MILYTDIIKQRNRINPNFSNSKRKPRIFQEHPCDGKVLSFGSGNVNSANHKEIKSLYKNVYSCDSDPENGADFRDINEIDEKFDFVICEHVFEHVKTEDFVNVLSKKLFDICSNKSKLLVTIPNVFNFGYFFSDFDHKNYSPAVDIASILCCVGFEFVDCCRWSKHNHMIEQSNMSQLEIFLESFLEKNYGLQLDRYITMVFSKNG